MPKEVFEEGGVGWHAPPRGPDPKVPKAFEEGWRGVTCAALAPLAGSPLAASRTPTATASAAATSEGRRSLAIGVRDERASAAAGASAGGGSGGF